MKPLFTQPMPVKLLIATNNQGKVIELRELLEHSPYDLLSLADFPDVHEIEETGTTFIENAGLKAIGYARQTGQLALADDSGLEVEALGGRPGVLSARYGGERAGFAEKMSLLLAELKKTGDSHRRARFFCSMAIGGVDGEIVHTASGICEGKIAASPRGSQGFGYDPIFIPNGSDMTFGELDSTVKRQISHRSRAFRQIIPFLRHFSAV